MSRESGVTIEYRFYTEGLLSCLKLASNPKPSAKIGDVLADCCFILYGSGDDSIILQEKLRDGTVALPSLETLRMGRLKLDLMKILYERSPRAL